MKAGQIILTLIIGGAVGFFTHSFIQRAEPLVQTPQSISADEASRYIERYLTNSGASPSVYLYVTDEMISEMADVKKKVREGNGYVLHMASITDDSEYDAVVYARAHMNVGEIPVEIEDYYFTLHRKGNYGTCPNMCDVISPMPK